MSSRRFAVLLPLLAHDDGPRVLLMKRPERETDPYSGQVCLPGGALEVDDTSLLDCALREANEELGIPAYSVEIISELRWQETGFKHEVKPFVGWIHNPPEIRPNPDEVEHVLYLPVSLIAPELFQERGTWTDAGGAKRELLTFRLDGYEVWGLTARILENGLNSGPEAVSIRRQIDTFSKS